MARNGSYVVGGLTRRNFLKLGALAGVGLISAGARGAKSHALLMRAIPSSGERIPAIGLGTSRTFDVGESATARAPLKEVLRLFANAGGKLVDTSPMYGEAETVVGDLAAELKLHPTLFLATKVWTEGRGAGIQQMETSMQRLRTQRLDLIQVHNLVDWDTHLKTLRAWKEEGRVRYLGITHYRADAFDELERLLKKEKLDFVQLNYSVAEREAEERLLPLAQERGVAVIVNRPFARAGLFRSVRDKKLPPWAADIDCASWAQFFLKFIVSHPAVTCAIPATSKPKHLQDNMQAGSGRLPDAATRKKMAALVQSL